MTISAINPNKNSQDLHLDLTRERQTETNANGYHVDMKGLVAAGLAGATTMVAGPLGAMGLVAAQGAASTIGGSGSAALTTMPAGTNGTQMSDMERIQADGFKNSTYLIALQQEIQQENRQFTTVTNVIRAKHDTAKAALANIRS